MTVVNYECFNNEIIKFVITPSVRYIIYTSLFEKFTQHQMSRGSLHHPFDLPRSAYKLRVDKDEEDPTFSSRGPKQIDQSVYSFKQPASSLRDSF